MFSSKIDLRVRYGETDQMGFVYYGNYALYFEVARVEVFRDLGMSYKAIEEEGFWLPVRDFHIDYYKPAYYDDLLTIECSVPELPSSRIKFHYKTFREGVCINEGFTSLVFVDKESGRPGRAPSLLLDALAKHFSAD
jgi:acyl-CoA thioester hydrolase